MKSRIPSENLSLYRTLLWIILCFSALFVGVLTNGYYNLFVLKAGMFALVVGAVLALLAWSIAKFIGRSPGGIKENIPLFILLLIVSAVGVFNSLMINLEGRKIALESIDDAAFAFTNLKSVAKEKLVDPILEAKRGRIEEQKALFFGELDNPLNCGQGPVARQIAANLSAELPGFRILEGKGQCGDIARLKKAYTEQIDDLIRNSEPYTAGGYNQVLRLRSKIFSTSDQVQENLASMRNEVIDGANIVLTTRQELEDVALTYQNLVLELLALTSPSNRSTQAQLPHSLQLESIRNLGEWSQLVNLIISRIAKPTTYIYIALAFFFDWILVYLFGKLSGLKRSLPPTVKQAPGTGISSPW